MTKLWIVLALGLAGVALTLQPAASADATTELTVVDRTVACAMGLWGGVRKIELRAQAGIRDIDDPATWKALPTIEVSNPYGGLYDGLAGLSAGYPPSGGLWVFPNPARCKASRRIQLAKAGLSSSAAGPFGDEYECPVPQKVLVRVRAVFAVPTELRKIWVDQLHRYRLLTASGDITQGELAVRTQSGKPLAYASADASGNARLLTAKSCTPS